MAFTEKNEYKVEVLNDGVLQVRRTDIILKDGVAVATSYHRHVINPGDDYSAEVDQVKKIAAAVHDADTIAAWAAAHPAEE